MISGILSFNPPISNCNGANLATRRFPHYWRNFTFHPCFPNETTFWMGWILMSGVLLFITGILILNNPTSPLWLLGLFLGV